MSADIVQSRDPIDCLDVEPTCGIQVWLFAWRDERRDEPRGKT